MVEVRKVKSLKNIEELGLSSVTEGYLVNNYSLDDTVREGRISAAKMGTSFEMTFKAQRWRMELVSALRRTGFLRPVEDFTMALNLGSLYSAVFPGIYMTSVDQLTNQFYEEFRGLREEIKEVVMSLQGQLSEKEFEMICYHFGLDGEDARSLNSLSRHFGMTREFARQIEAETLTKLREHNTLPQIAAITIRA